MTTNKKLKDIIGEDEYQTCLDLGRTIIRCPICGNETFNDWFICPHCNWEAEIELYKKDLHDTDNHDGVITDLEPDILECEVKWALESITTNKARGRDGIPVELFQILKDDAMKVLHSICQQIWKTQQWPRDWKRQVLNSYESKIRFFTPDFNRKMH